MKPYFQNDTCTLYCGDAREVLPRLYDGNEYVTLTGPPWAENYDTACNVIGALRSPVIICQWTEISRPPCSLPLVAAHIWLNADSQGMRYQPFYHFDEDGMRRRSAIMQYPNYNRTHDRDFPVELAQCLLMKTTALPVFDPFAGTGATLLAARNLKRNSVGIEIDEKKCEAAVQRLTRA